MVSRARVGMGIVAVTSGTAWALGGIDSLVTAARALAELLPLLLVIGGAAAILLVVVPRGVLAGPVLIIAIGALGLAVELGAFHGSLVTHAAAFILIGLGVVVAMSRPEKQDIDVSVQRCTAVLFPARRRISGKAPRKLIARAVFGLLCIDLAQATHSGLLSMDITCVLGRVELTLPKELQVQAGRVELARRMTFEGRLTSSDLGPSGEQAGEANQKLVLLNIQGWAGAVRVRQG
jgi:hypothetical protein